MNPKKIFSLDWEETWILRGNERLGLKPQILFNHIKKWKSLKLRRVLFNTRNPASSQQISKGQRIKKFVLKEEQENFLGAWPGIVPYYFEVKSLWKKSSYKPLLFANLIKQFINCSFKFGLITKQTFFFGKNHWKRILPISLKVLKRALLKIWRINFWVFLLKVEMKTESKFILNRILDIRELSR